MRRTEIITIDLPYLVEIKARTSGPDLVREHLIANGAVLQGRDHQVDHYFRVPDGRLKLRLGTIERSLIFYQRPDQAGPKDSKVSLCRLEDVSGDASAQLLDVLTTALGEWNRVDKQREIYWADNVKLHLDEVAGLGTFVEIEAIGDTADQHEALEKQCRAWMNKLDIADNDLIEGSYSDMEA